MKKCYNCPYSSDKCKNPNSKNQDKFIDDIKACKPLLIKNVTNPIKVRFKVTIETLILKIVINIPGGDVHERKIIYTGTMGKC